MKKINKKALAYAFPIAVVILASLFASGLPDTLEFLAAKMGFAQSVEESTAIFTDYTMPFMKENALSNICAGIVGLILLFVLYKIINAIITKHSNAKIK
ncbi:MAG: PDGLE domain-containing protein [Elusimicrobiota bacterium]|jgi:hypothetical protein|nr:PDGLE domain-containing protein [Elusimicrobiota bacterium]